MRTADFDFKLPQELIAQRPACRRDASRLFVVNRPTARFEHGSFSDLPSYLRSGDVLVLNDSKVIPARLRARNSATGGAFEVLLLEELATNEWWAMMRPGKRARIGTEIVLVDRRGEATAITATVHDANAEGHRRLRFAGTTDLRTRLDAIGELPLPPYIERPVGNESQEDAERYQTIYARDAGSVAAPTAGLHLTDQLLHRLKQTGVQICNVTLHVGLGTFAPVKAERVEEHAMHSERFSVPDETARTINAAKEEKRRIIAVGTTSVRVLESVARKHSGRVAAGTDRTDIFIYPPAKFEVVDALVTNFHLPQSTLLMLVSAFAAPGATTGREIVLRAYAEAVRERYRFFSYGDAMLIL